MNIIIENITKRLEYGKPYMKKLSELDIRDIVDTIDKIWENSYMNFYEKIQNGEMLKKEYDNKVINIEYNSKLEIENIKIKWACWDCIVIELSAMGINIIYKPEHGSYTKLLDLTWVLISDLFFKK